MSVDLNQYTMTSEAVIEDGIQAHEEGDGDMEKIYIKYPSLKKQVEADDDVEVRIYALNMP